MQGPCSRTALAELLECHGVRRGAGTLFILFGARRAGGYRVLVVDDNADAAESLADLVRLLGHSAEVAHDGPSAIEKVRANPPNVVFCDIGLPGMSGYDVAKALRASALKGVQLIAVSGYAQPKPEDVASTVLSIVKQPRSAWSFEVEARPFGEKW